MEAVNFDDVDFIPYPVILQPKLNGIRARWDGKQLVSRQCEIWNESALPLVFTALHKWSALNPGIVLDGELYAHGAPFQVLEGICAVKRTKPKEGHHLIQLHAFDIISEEPAEKRLEKLSQIYKPHVGFQLVSNPRDIDSWLAQCVEHMFEGVMLRLLGVPYQVGRTEALIKLKPWRYATAEIVDFNEGKGKYKGTLGALVLKSTFSGRTVIYCSSGSISDEERGRVWNNKDFWLKRMVTIRYRELSKSYTPLQPQIYKLFV